MVHASQLACVFCISTAASSGVIGGNPKVSLDPRQPGAALNKCLFDAYTDLPERGNLFRNIVRVYPELLQ